MIPYGKLVAAVVLLLVIAGAYVQGRRDGTKIVQAEYAQRDLKSANDYADKEREITEAYRKKESQLAQSFATVGSKLQQERLKHAATKNDLDAALVAGTLVLRDPGTVSPSCGGQAASTAPGASGNNDNAQGGLQGQTAGVVLSQQTAKWLVDFADEADAVTIQLQACQRVLVEERK